VGDFAVITVRTLIVLGLLLLIPSAAHAAAPPPYSAPVHGELAGWRLSGVEPDGDPLYQAVMQTVLAPAHGLPAMNLIVDTYYEQFKPDTTPILPDLLHKNRQAQNLGAFLQGKILLTDDAGNVVSIGSFISEAFLDNTNNAVMMLYGGAHGYGARGTLSGIYNLKVIGNQAVKISGRFSGRLSLSKGARQAIVAHRGARMKSLKRIISQVTVVPHAMVGRNVTKSSSVPLHTEFSGVKAKKPTFAGSSSGHPISPVTIVSAGGAVLCFLLAAVLYWRGRRAALSKGQRADGAA
jgi:hypothetical protein